MPRRSARFRGVRADGRTGLTDPPESREASTSKGKRQLAQQDVTGTGRRVIMPGVGTGPDVVSESIERQRHAARGRSPQEGTGLLRVTGIGEFNYMSSETLRLALNLLTLATAGG